MISHKILSDKLLKSSTPLRRFIGGFFAMEKPESATMTE